MQRLNKRAVLQRPLYLKYLSEANLIQLLRSPKKGMSFLTKADFMVNNQYVFEVGGKNKEQKQIKGLDNAYIVADDIEIGFRNKIPLWLFGYLY